jgi:hypothetical protein
MKEFLISVLHATLQRDSDSVASLFNEDGSLKDDAATTVKNWHAEHLKAVRERDGTAMENGYKKAHKEIDEKLRKQVKNAFDFETDLKGEEYIDALKAHVDAAKPEGAGAITEEAVKNHPTFRNREKELLKQVAAANESKTAEVEKIQKEYSRKEAMSKVSEKAVALFKSKNPILSTDEAKANKAIKSLLLDPISGYDYEVNEKGEIVSISKDGKRLEDANGNPVSFESLVFSTADESFEFKKIVDKNSPGGGGDAGGAGEKPVLVPKNEEEYRKVIADPKVPLEERTKIQEAYKAAQTQN